MNTKKEKRHVPTPRIFKSSITKKELPQKIESLMLLLEDYGFDTDYATVFDIVTEGNPPLIDNEEIESDDIPDEVVAMCTNIETDTRILYPNNDKRYEVVERILDKLFY
jgi:hypothetical protein